MISPPPRRDALAGLVVLDFTIVMSGPMATRLMADAGADVIKLEAPDGDVVRQRPPLPPLLAGSAPSWPL